VKASEVTVSRNVGLLLQTGFLLERADVEAAETTEVVVETASNEVVRGVSS